MDHGGHYDPTQPEQSLWQFNLPGLERPLIGIFGEKRNNFLPGVPEISDTVSQYPDGAAQCSKQYLGYLQVVILLSQRRASWTSSYSTLSWALHHPNTC